MFAAPGSNVNHAADCAGHALPNISSFLKRRPLERRCLQNNGGRVSNAGEQ
jgi:hypothetical protein